MRMTLWITLALTLAAASGCRTTHDADEGELAQLDLMGEALYSGSEVDGDNGEAALGSLFGSWGYFQDVGDKDQGAGGAVGLPMTSGGEGFDGAFVARARDEWPDCLTSEEGSVTYNNCEYAGSYSGTGGSASIAFLVDGHYNWTDTSSDAELVYDLNVGANDYALETTLQWVTDMSWSDSSFDGDFQIDYAMGVSVGGTPPLGGMTFHADGSFDQVTWSEDCDESATSGIIDWTVRSQQGTDPPKTRHVTVEFLGCGSATITS